MKKLLLIPSFFFGLLNAQSFTPEVISAGGNYITNEGYSLSQTIAEMTMVSTLSASSSILTQGFEQPDFKNIVGITDFAPSSGVFDLFPNPANNFFYLKYEFLQEGELQMVIYNTLGQQVSPNFADTYVTGKKTFTVYTADLAAAIYYVKAVFTATDGKQYSFSKKLEVIR